MTFTNTSHHSTKVVLGLVKWVLNLLEVGDYVTEIKMTHSKWNRQGRCWGRRVLLRVGDPCKFPMKDVSYRGLKTAPVYDLEDWQEALVQLAGHEFQHSRQFRYKTKKSEIEAEQQSLWVLSEFRKNRATIMEKLK